MYQITLKSSSGRNKLLVGQSGGIGTVQVHRVVPRVLLINPERLQEHGSVARCPVATDASTARRASLDLLLPAVVDAALLSSERRVRAVFEKSPHCESVCGVLSARRWARFTDIPGVFRSVFLDVLKCVWTICRLVFSDHLWCFDANTNRFFSR
ncbi:hypothetical protein WA026_012181 [Henosepilachna vigintioctopunctata]|uniref:Uncharacterized protein n=1 Tax=Henosepilachna vigintioctopunctata TaxID=420089 RepID=A0AAW1VB32_9CUCU